jgi:uncharacterized protein YbjT (DUF2867 family)
VKVLVIGANGNTATRVIEGLVNGPHDPVAMIRQPDQRAKFDALGVPTVLADLEYPIDHALQGADAIIFAAGSGGKTGKDKTVLVDHIGAIRSMVAAQVAGISRYIMLSSIGNDIHSTSPIAHYHKAKAHADNFLCESGLEFTIVCPGGLTDDAANARVSVAQETNVSGKTSRANVALALIACLDLPNTINKTFSLLDGDQELGAALAGVE